ncbi:ankyrin repeat-containing protein [Haloferula helveola]|uniref:Ankyrin repeat-containing protein n=2 Tax=Haloferula helveola TaxID=490095 RepID=A0ABM7RFQ2_9BACT|nr:ankyrin repeat-containing protein [Haloferula helveola]
MLAIGIALLSASCDSPGKRAMKELSARKIEASGPALLRAVEENDVSNLQLLLAAGVFTDQRDEQGRSPLHRAIEAGQMDAAWLLIDGGADVHAETPDGVTPLTLAVVSEQQALVDRLLDAGAKPDGLTPDGSMLIPWAIRNGRIDLVRSLMKGGADPHQKDVDGNPLLHVAMEAGRKQLAAELVSLGADCGATNAAGESALVIAIRKGWRDQVGPLVRRGADPNLPDAEGLTPLERAIREEDFSFAAELGRLGAVPAGGSLEVALADAYDRRDADRARWLLRFGARPSPDGGRCLVRQAVEDDEIGFLHLFLGYTGVPDGLLYENCRSGRTHIVSLLLAHGANPNPCRAPFLETPFTAAVSRCGDGLAMRLLAAGANPNLRGASGARPLHVAIARGRPASVRMLLGAGVNVNSPLETPADPRFLKMVRGATMRFLLKKDQRVTPLMLAVDSGSVETARLLLERGADINVWTRRHRIWPINIAGRNSDVPMMRLLLGKDPHVEQREVIIDLSDQRLQVFGTSGEEIFNTKVSTGRKGYETRTGEFAITNRYRHWTSTIYNAGMPYFQRLSCSDFGFHQGYVPSYPASHGCIRVPAGNASKLFTLLELGDRVRIVP